MAEPYAAPDDPSDEERLRELAESRLADERRAQGEEGALVQELRVHQIELEVQNESLRCAHAELERVRDEYADLYDRAPVGYVTADGFGTIVRANATLARLLETTVGELVGSQLSAHCQHAYYLHCRQLARGAGPRREDIEVVTGRGRRRVLSVESTLLPGAQHEDDRVRSALLDVTDQRRFQERAQRAQRLETIGTLAGGVAHDFNNIMAIVMGSAEVALGQVPPGGEVHGLLSGILAATRRASNVVRQLLHFSGKAEAMRIPFVLQQAVAEGLDLIRATLPPSTEIRRALEAPEAVVLGDPVQIHQVVMNLCNNAALALEPEGGGVVNVAVRPVAAPGAGDARGWVELSVRDTGPGIPPDALGLVFDPYFTTREVGKGSGMGLAVVEGIATALGGTVVAENAAPRGATFRLRLPTTDQAPAAGGERAPAAGERAPAGRGQRILFVDDEPDVVRLGVMLLERLGYVVVGESDSTRALAQVRADPEAFDLVVADVAMPGLSGDALCLQLRALRPGLPVLLCSGHGQEALRATERVAVGFLEKPFSAASLGAAVGRALRG